MTHCGVTNLVRSVTSLTPHRGYGLMKIQVGILASLLAFSAPIVASDDSQLYYTEAYHEIVSVETIDITELDRAVDLAIKDNDPPNGPLEGLNEAELILDRIIAIGDKIWKIIERNKPVVNLSSQHVDLLPDGARSWNQLQGWKTPQSRVYQTLYKNAYGMNVVEFNYRVIFTPGGNVNGKGQYLARVEIEPAVVNVAWGYKFSAQGEVFNPTNAGTRQSPIAAMELRLNWQVNTVLRHMQESTRFYVRGDGLFENLSNGNMPAQ